MGSLRGIVISIENCQIEAARQRRKENSIAGRAETGKRSISFKKALNDAPGLTDILQPQAVELEKRLKQEQQVDLSHWRLLSAEWMDGLDVWH